MEKLVHSFGNVSSYGNLFFITRNATFGSFAFRCSKRALEIYSLLSTSKCIPKEISNFSKNMLERLGKKIEDTHR